MVVIVWVVGLLFVVLGISSILKPQTIKIICQKFIKGKNIQIMGVLLFIIGVFLLAAAFKAKIFWYVFIIGILMCVKGLLWLLKPYFVQKSLNKFINAAEYTCKLWGLIVYTLGIFLIIWGR